MAHFDGEQRTMNIKGLDSVEALHEDSVVIDAHCDALARVVESQRRLGERSAEGQFDFPRAIDGGLTASLMATSFFPQRGGTKTRQTLQQIDAFYQEVDSYSDLAMRAVCAGDILQAKERDKIALILSMEGAEGIEGDLAILRVYYRLGLRVLGVTWNRRNEAADGLDEIRTGGGLTRFGVDLIKECNRLGIIIDVAHLAPAGVEDVLELSESPVVATHANCHAVWSHPRNLTDVQLKAIGKKGGVVGVTPVPPFLGRDEKRGHFSDLLDHIDHMVSIMGEDGVGLGMDFDGMGNMRTGGVEDVSRLLNLTKGLTDCGYTPKTVRKILGGNFLRVFRQLL